MQIKKSGGSRPQLPPQARAGAEHARPAGGRPAANDAAHGLARDGLKSGGGTGSLSKLQLPKNPPVGETADQRRAEFIDLAGKTLGWLRDENTGGKLAYAGQYEARATELLEQYNTAHDAGDTEACERIQSELEELAKDVNEDLHTAFDFYAGDLPRH